MVKGYFYNATDPNDTERKYNGKDMNEDKAPFYKEGVVFGHLEVTAGEGMTVKVDGGSRTGYAYINLHTIHNTTILELTVGRASGTLPRFDRVILRNDETERRPSIFIREGAYSRNPSPPVLINNDTIQEKSLAKIYIKAGAVEITQADITDERADDTVCGFVASQFQELDFSQLSKQFEDWSSRKMAEIEEKYADFVRRYTELEQAFREEMQQEHSEFVNETEKEHTDFVERYRNLTQNFVEEYEGFTKQYAALLQGFMGEQAELWSRWFEEKKAQLNEDVTGNMQLQIDAVTYQALLDRISASDKNTEFQEDGSILEMEKDGSWSKHTVFEESGNIIETYADERYEIRKITEFREDGTIEESYTMKERVGDQGGQA